MPTLEVIKAWKDEEYRDTLTLEQRAHVPEHPSGLIELEEPKRESSFAPEPVIASTGTLTKGGQCHTFFNHCK